MNVQAFEECRKNFKTRLRMWKCLKSTGRISRPDSEYGNVQRVQEDYQAQIMNVEVCEELGKISGLY